MQNIERLENKIGKIIKSKKTTIFMFWARLTQRLVPWLDSLEVCYEHTVASFVITDRQL